MKGEDFSKENVRETWSVESLDCGDETSHLGESIHHYKDAVEAFAVRKTLDEIHRDGIPRSFWNREEAKGAIRFMVSRFRAATFRA